MTNVIFYCTKSRLLAISSGQAVRHPSLTKKPPNWADLSEMRRIDELHLNFAFAGARMLRNMLKLEGFAVGRKHVRTLMDKMGIAALYRKRNMIPPITDQNYYLDWVVKGHSTPYWNPVK